MPFLHNLSLQMDLILSYMPQVERGEVTADKLSRKNLMTAVAYHKRMLLGQKVRLEGRWIKHAKYGYQLQVRHSVSLGISGQIYSLLLAASNTGIWRAAG